LLALCISATAQKSGAAKLSEKLQAQLNNRLRSQRVFPRLFDRDDVFSRTENGARRAI
jgi:hypothetical protein